MLYITFVLYNKRLQDIGALKSVMNLASEKGDISIIVVDNSDIIIDNSDSEVDFIDGKSIKYIRNGENLGLSKSYNKALKFAFDNSSDINSDFMLFLDDDSDYSYDLLEEIYMTSSDDKINKDGVNVICGLIDSGGSPMSPIKRFKMKYSDDDFITASGVYDDIICINSGTAVRLSVLKKADGFEEKLFLDMIDYMLFHRLKEMGVCKVLVLDKSSSQSFSGRTKQNKSTVLNRFNIFKKDFKVYAELTGLGKTYTEMYLLKRRLMICLKSGE